MKKHLLLFLCFSLFSCGDLVDKITSKIAEEKKEAEQTSIDFNKRRIKKEIGEYYAGVDQLRVREFPNLNKKVKVVSSLNEGEKVFFTGIESNEIFEVKLRGRMVKGPFYKIKTRKGKTGWVFSGALSSFPIDVEYYRVAIFFDEAGNVEEGGDFGYYASEAMNELLGTGVEAMFIDNNFEEVEIRNIRGDIIGVENISRLVKKHEIGVICIEKGRSHKYVDYSTDMGFDILEIFDLIEYEGC